MVFFSFFGQPYINLIVFILFYFLHIFLFYLFFNLYSLNLNFLMLMIRKNSLIAFWSVINSLPWFSGLGPPCRIEDWRQFPCWKVVYLCRPGQGQLHVIFVPASQGLSIKGTQGNLWPLKEIPSPCLLAERRAFVHWHVSHTFWGQISPGFMKPGFIFGHCNVPMRAERS